MLRQYEYSCFPRFESASFSHFVVLVLARQCAVCGRCAVASARTDCGRVALRRRHGISRGRRPGRLGAFIAKRHTRKPPVSHILYTRGRGSLERNTSQPATHPKHIPHTHSPHACTTLPRRPHTLSHRRTLKSGRAHKRARAALTPTTHTPFPLLLPHYRLSSSLSTHTRKIAHRPPKRMRRQLFTNGAATCATAP